MAARYPEIKKYILEQIDAGHYKEGVMLPSEKEFTQLFHVSRMTIRRALDDLIQDGILIRKRGSGVFLSRKKIERSIEKVSISHDKAILEKYKELSVKIIEFKIVHDHYIVKKNLGIENEDAYQIKRVQLGDNQPIVYEKIFLPVRYFSKITKEECYQSFANVVNNHFTGECDEEHRHNQIVVSACLATKRISSLLQVPVNSPILQMSIVVCGENEEKYYCGINSYSGEDFYYTEQT